MESLYLKGAKNGKDYPMIQGNKKKTYRVKNINNASYELGGHNPVRSVDAILYVFSP